jgi:nucleotide-binding universal stress UspA family protein
VSAPDMGAGGSHPKDHGSPIERLLVVADAAVAEVDGLPPAVRAVIDDAADVYVLTPTLPGRLEWLADDVDRFRHAADERLDVVLGHMHSIGAHASGGAIRGSLLTVIADAVAEFKPDHILLALRSSEHANWQERRLIGHLEKRFGLPLTTFAVDLGGHASIADGPLLLCYDGSEDAKRAIEGAGALFAGRRALVVTVWQPTAVVDSFAWLGATAGEVDFFELDRAAAEAGGGIAEEGARVALEADLKAEPVAVEATGPVWTTIVEIADRNNAEVIVMGSRGLTGVRSMLLGSVSSAVVHHADRPTLIIRRSSEERRIAARGLNGDATAPSPDARGGLGPWRTDDSRW